MRKAILASAFALIGSAAIISAQDQNPRPSPPAAPADPQQQRVEVSPAARSGAGGNVTIQGCLQRGTGASSSTPGATATAGAPGFMLSNATPSTSSSSTTQQSGAATATASASTTATSYRLDGEDSKLTPHVGHKVEITGTLDSSSAAGSAPSGGASASASAMAPKLKVDAVKMIAATCP